MTHTDMNELYELYVLGALELDAAAEIDTHLADNCEYCLGHIHQAVRTTAALASLAEPVAPPPEIRQRLLAGLKGSTARKPRSWSFLVPALAAACLALLGFSLWSVSQVNSTRTTLDHVLGERDQLRSALEILSQSQTRTVQFGSADNVAHGRVFVNRNTGFVLVGSDLPQIASDRTFQLWAIPASGAPISAGLFRANANGRFVHVSQQPVNTVNVAAVAVSVEPQGGSPAPTTKPILVVPLT